jgi:lysophospholipase L1-like esterase
MSHARTALVALCLMGLAASALARPEPRNRGGGDGGGRGGRGGGRRGTGGGDTIRILALGDSITQGSVPSKNENHPYTIQLEQRIAAATGKKVEMVNAGASLGALREAGTPPAARPAHRGMHVTNIAARRLSTASPAALRCP